MSDSLRESIRESLSNAFASLQDDDALYPDPEETLRSVLMPLANALREFDKDTVRECLRLLLKDKPSIEAAIAAATDTELEALMPLALARPPGDYTDSEFDVDRAFKRYVQITRQSDNELLIKLRLPLVAAGALPGIEEYGVQSLPRGPASMPPEPNPGGTPAGAPEAAVADYYVEGLVSISRLKHGQIPQPLTFGSNLMVRVPDGGFLPEQYPPLAEVTVSWRNPDSAVPSSSARQIMTLEEFLETARRRAIARLDELRQARLGRPGGPDERAPG